MLRPRSAGTTCGPSRVKRVSVGHQPQHAERADPPPADDRAAGEVQHGVLHGDPAPRAEGGARAVHRRGRQPARRAGADREGRLRRASRRRGGRLRQDDDHHRRSSSTTARVVKGSADFGKGSPANPMSDDELADKFRQCAEWGGLDRDQTNRRCSISRGASIRSTTSARLRGTCAGGFERSQITAQSGPRSGAATGGHAARRARSNKRK